MNGLAAHSLGLKKARVKAFDNQRPDENCKDGERDGGYGCEQHKSLIRKGERRAEENMQQVDVAAANRDDEHSCRKGDEVEGGKAGILSCFEILEAMPERMITRTPAMRPPIVMDETESPPMR